MYSSGGDGALFQAEPLPATRATYRREFEEMENRIRKCERQRAELERQFEGLMRERAECEKAAVRAMKQRQRRLMEAERQRTERNESILRMLNKIDQQAASLAAKTDRLKMLKTQYEMYLMRTWSQPYAAYNVPMIAAPPPTPPPPSPPTKLLQTPNPVSTKSEFVQYLSDLTHQQTTNVNPIPPPTALSNYLASQQKPHGTTPSVSYGGPPLERPYSRALTLSSRSGLLETNETTTNAANGSSGGGSRAAKFEMSNEDFIRYIDSEVLKEPIPTVSVVGATPTEPNEIKPSKGGAYLEDASEDEPVVEELSNKLEECSMLIEPARSMEKQQQNNIQPLDDRTIESGIDVNRSVPEEASRETEERTLKQPLQTVTFEDNLGAVVTDEFTSDHSEQQINEFHESPTVTAADTYCDTIQHEHLVEERNEELSETEAYPEQSNYNAATDVHSELPLSGDNQPQEMLLHTADSTAYLAAQPEEEQSFDNQQYSAASYEVKTEDATFTAGQPFQQPSEGRNQHWNTARQALRAKAFPTASSKPPSPEMADQNVQNEPTSTEYVEEKLAQSPVQGDNSEPNASVGNVLQNAEHATYGEDANGAYYETDGNVPEQQQSIDAAQATTAQEYLNDAMGQPVEYQESHYQSAQHDDGQQAAAYHQYGDSQAEGQYVEGAATGDTHYQYQAPAYATQNAYQDPNQQYQYDANDQYYGDQQQGYDGQYYAPEQQQYYMDETQQQQLEQLPQDHPTDQYPQQVDPAGYYPSEAQYEADPVHHQPDQKAPTDDVAHTGDSDELKASTFPSTEPDATGPPADPSPVIDHTLPPKDKQSIDTKTAKKDTEPTSDALSTVNDESDFDFSSQ